MSNPCSNTPTGQGKEIPKKHILFIAFPAFGHIIPLLELAKKTSQFHHVTFVISTSKLDELHKRELVSDQMTNLQLVGLPDGLNFDFGTITAAPGLVGLNRFIEYMKPAVDALLRGMPVPASVRKCPGDSPIAEPVDVVIVERFLISITMPVCRDRGVPCYVFNACNGTGISAGLQVTEGTPSVPDSEAVGISDNSPMIASKKTFLLNINSQLCYASGIIVNTFTACYRQCVEDLAVHPGTRHIPVFCIGPIFPPAKFATAAVTAQVEAWLDRQVPRSVVYVAFGSLVHLTAEQMEILFNALLANGKPFICSIPDTLQHCLPHEIRTKISSQFQAENAPFIVLSWAPQKNILTHPSAGVILTHTGWNSTLEGIVGGVPMVSWPMFADQHDNGEWIVQQGFGVLISGTKVSGGRLVPACEIRQALDDAVQCRETIFKMSQEARKAVADNGSSQVDFIKLMRFDCLPADKGRVSSASV